MATYYPYQEITTDGTGSWTSDGTGTVDKLEDYLREINNQKQKIWEQHTKEAYKDLIQHIEDQQESVSTKTRSGS